MNYILLVLVIIGYIILFPIASIWALNTLFPSLNILVSLETWLAVVILGSVVGGKTLLTYTHKQ